MLFDSVLLDDAQSGEVAVTVNSPDLVPRAVYQTDRPMYSPSGLNVKEQHAEPARSGALAVGVALDQRLAGVRGVVGELGVGGAVDLQADRAAGSVVHGAWRTHAAVLEHRLADRVPAVLAAHVVRWDHVEVVPVVAVLQLLKGEAVLDVDIVEPGRVLSGLPVPPYPPGLTEVTYSAAMAGVAVRISPVVAAARRSVRVVRIMSASL